MNDESQLALARFDFRSGAYRGSQLTLYPRCLVHRSESQLETVPLARVTAIKVSFERDTTKLGWGIACVIGALLVLALSGEFGGRELRAALDVLDARGARTIVGDAR